MKLPDGAKIISEKTFLSGELKEIIYELNGKFYLTDDWSWTKPQEISKEFVEQYIGKKLDKD